MKLELKHLAPYLPYGLKIQHIISGEIKKFEGIMEYFEDDTFFLYWVKNNGTLASSSNYKPILRPLSDLTKEIEIYGEENWKNIPMDIIDGKSCSLVGGKEFKIMLKNGTYNIYELRYATYNFLLENHFDVFGLIEQNLAINKNEL